MLERVLYKHHRHLREAAKRPQTENEVHLPLEEPVTEGKISGTAPLTRAQKDSAWRRERRLERYERLVEYQRQGLSLRAIAQKMNLSRNTVRKWGKAGTCPEPSRRTQRSVRLTPYADYLRQRWQAGCHNAVQLYAELKDKGFTGSVNLIQRHVKPWRQAHKESPQQREAPPSPRCVRWWLLGHFSKTNPQQKAEQQAFVERLVTMCPEIKTIQVFTQRFIEIVKQRRSEAFSDWLAEAEASQTLELGSFACSLRQDEAAVCAALTSPVSNGQTEGQVNRLKLIKRSMYGRANFDLLQARVLPMVQAA